MNLTLYKQIVEWNNDSLGSVLIAEIETNNLGKKIAISFCTPRKANLYASNRTTHEHTAFNGWNHYAFRAENSSDVCVLKEEIKNPELTFGYWRVQINSTNLKKYLKPIADAYELDDTFLQKTIEKINSLCD